jgi:hypothetical protein
MTTPTNSYMITNRQQPNSTSYKTTVPLGNGTLWWYMSTAGVYDPTIDDYEPQSSNPSTTAPSTFQNAIVAQLQAQTNPSLTIFIHGLGTEWSDAITDTASLGSYMTKYGPYNGLVIGFSWPSYGEWDSALNYATGYPPPATSGSIRDNINGSRQSFGNLISWTQNLAAAVPGLAINIICHSEGNYMLMLGLASVSSIQLNQIILLAADINNGALQIPSAGLVGQGAKIATLSNRVSVYYSSNDSVLADSEGAFGAYHNPSFAGRLGLSGPNYDQGSQQPNSNGIDCSSVVNATYVAALPPGIIPPGTTLHSTYRYIPQILEDITQTIGGTASGSVVNRQATGIAGSYYMKPVTSVTTLGAAHRYTAGGAGQIGARS